MLSETKLDASFPRGQFFIKGYTNPYRLDRTANGGGILLYIRENIPSTLVNFPGATGDIENLFVEINLRKKKWLLGCCYKSSQTYDFVFFRHYEKETELSFLKI